MNIVYKNVDEIIPYDNNPRNNDNAVDKVASSIEEFGFKVPIVLDKDDEVVAGHTRLKAAKSLGMDKVPCIVADDLTDEQVKAFRLADNKTSEFAEWDWDLLNKELDQISLMDMSDFGFDDGLPDIDIDGIFEENENEERSHDDYLVWAGNKVEVDEVDIEILDNKLNEYNSLDVSVSFVRWLTGED